MLARLCSLFLFGCVLTVALAGDAPKKTPREALQPFGDLIGVWNGTGIFGTNPTTARDGFWTERLDWGWKFKGKNAWLVIGFDQGKHFASGELHWVADDNSYQLKLKTTDKQDLVFEGTLSDKNLVLYREDAAKKETQRVTLQMLHPNRIVYRYATKPEGRTLFKQLYQVSAGKEGIPFAAGDSRPECVVSGGLGTIAVSYQGKTYYVCCSGCRDEFRATPEKYIKEYEAKKKAKK